MNKCTKGFILGFTFFFFLIFESSFAHISLGGFVPHAGSIQSDENGNRNYTSFVGIASVNYKFKVYEEYYLYPEIYLTLPVNGESDHTRQYTIYSLYAGMYLSDLLFIRAGLSTINQTVSHTSGTILLNNGSSYSTFYGVDGSYTASTSGICMGIESPLFKGYKNLTFKLDFHLQSLLNPSYLKLSYMLGINYDFGGDFGGL
jgi:hypothetical protein